MWHVRGGIFGVHVQGAAVVRFLHDAKLLHDEKRMWKGCPLTVEVNPGMKTQYEVEQSLALVHHAIERAKGDIVEAGLQRLLAYNLLLHELTHTDESVARALRVGVAAPTSAQKETDILDH